MSHRLIKTIMLAIVAAIFVVILFSIVAPLSPYAGEAGVLVFALVMLAYFLDARRF